MKIRAVTPFLMQAGSPRESAWSGGAQGGLSSSGSRHWCFVKIETDDGPHGVGEGSGWPKVVATAIADLAPLLIGEDARHIDRLWHKLFNAQMGHGQTGVVGAGALSAIDIALWDLNAKALGIPVWRMLGGQFRDRVRAYAHASTLEFARESIDAGYTALKVGHVAEAARKARALRDEFGDAIDIAVDLHGPPWLTAQDAIRLLKDLEPLDPLFVEEPVAPEDIEGLRRVRAATSLPLAAGERSALLWGYKRLIGENLVDIVQPDTGRVGGLSQLRKIAAYAEAHFITVAPHAGTLGPVAEAAALHFMAAIPNALIMERFGADWEGRERVAGPPLELRDGHLLAPETPGLGIDLVIAEIERHPAGFNVAAPSAKLHSAYEEGTATEHLYAQPRRRRAAFFDLPHDDSPRAPNKRD